MAEEQTETQTSLSNPHEGNRRERIEEDSLDKALLRKKYWQDGTGKVIVLDVSDPQPGQTTLQDYANAASQALDELSMVIPKDESPLLNIVLVPDNPQLGFAAEAAAITQKRKTGKPLTIILLNQKIIDFMDREEQKPTQGLTRRTKRKIHHEVAHCLVRSICLERQVNPENPRIAFMLEPAAVLFEYREEPDLLKEEAVLAAEIADIPESFPSSLDQNTLNTFLPAFLQHLEEQSQSTTQPFKTEQLLLRLIEHCPPGDDPDREGFLDQRVQETLIRSRAISAKAERTNLAEDIVDAEQANIEEYARQLAGFCYATLRSLERQAGESEVTEASTTVKTARGIIPPESITEIERYLEQNHRINLQDSWQEWRDSIITSSPRPQSLKGPGPS